MLAINAFATKAFFHPNISEGEINPLPMSNYNHSPTRHSEEKVRFLLVLGRQKIEMTEASV
jgi:hypothetical protein